MLDPLLETLALLGATFGYCILSGFVPLFNAELYLIAVGSAATAPPLLLLALAATAGQMVAKSSMYLAGSGMAHIEAGRFDQKIQRWRDRVEAWRHRPHAVLFASGSAGLPPLYVVSLLAGALGVGFARFALFCSAGRYLRFALCLAFPQLLKSWIL